jgi:hypothetical protein
VGPRRVGRRGRVTTSPRDTGDLWERHWYDPPWKSIPEGRGLPRTRLLKAMLPLAIVVSLAFTVLVFVVAAVSAWLG